MKRVFKIAVCSITILAMSSSMSGCFDSRELNMLGYVMGTAIDKGNSDGETELTLQLAKVVSEEQSSESGSSSKGGGSSGASYVNVSDKGENINEITRDMEHNISRRLYVAHNRVIIFGEELAKDGVRDVLDFFARAPEGRMTLYMVVAKGKAAEILEVEPVFEKIPSSDLERLVKDYKLTSTIPAVTLFDFVNDMLSKTKAPVAPVVEIVEEEDKKKLRLIGSAVFKEGKMIDMLDYSESRGMLFINDEVEQGIIMVEVKGSRAAVEIRKAKSTVKPGIKSDGSVVVDIEVEETVGIGDQYGADNLADPENIPLLLRQVEKETESVINSAIDKAKELGTDIFGFGKKIYKKQPRKWREIENKWEDKFKEMKINIKVKAKADGSGRIMQPIVPVAE